MHSSSIHYIQFSRVGFWLLLTPSIIYLISLLERKKKTDSGLFLLRSPLDLPQNPIKRQILTMQ